MASNTSTIRLRAGATAILVFVATVIGLGLILSSGLESTVAAESEIDYAKNLAANTTVLANVVWVQVIFSVLIAIFGIDLYRVLTDGRSGLLFAPIAFIGGAVLFIIQILLVLGISQELAPVYASATGAEQTAMKGTLLALLRFRISMFVVAGILISLAAINFGREMLRSAEFPGWMGYLGYVAGVTGVIGGFFPLFDPLFVLKALGRVLLVLWVLIAGIILLRSR